MKEGGGGRGASQEGDVANAAALLPANMTFDDFDEYIRDGALAAVASFAGFLYKDARGANARYALVEHAAVKTRVESLVGRIFDDYCEHSRDAIPGAVNTAMSDAIAHCADKLKIRGMTLRLGGGGPGALVRSTTLTRIDATKAVCPLRMCTRICMC